MRTKIVYVLVSSDNDIYLEQAYVSTYSLKYYMPDVDITLLTDRMTAESLKGIRSKEIEFVDDIVVVDLDCKKFNAQQRSRQLKTSVRKYIKGDFLFVDCDTIIVRPLDEIDKIEVPIAACRDAHSNFINSPYRELSLKHGHLLDWPIDNEDIYFNSGVIYVKDVPEAYDFYERWNDNLNKGYAKKIFMDQPSFAKTNYELGHIVKPLDDIWNCELKHGIRYLKDAKIVHYLCTNPSPAQVKQLFLLNEQEVLMKIKKDGIISDDIIDVIKDPFKGLSEVTHCFAGEDIYFFQTETYNHFRYYFKRNHISYIEKTIHFLKKTKSFFK
jgi:hypothetical protein